MDDSLCDQPAPRSWKQGATEDIPSRSKWVKLLANGEYYGDRNGPASAPLTLGQFTKVKAVWKSGCVSCLIDATSRTAWQCCGGATNQALHGHPLVAASFELIKQTASGVSENLLQQPDWHTLPPECTKRADVANADIVCEKSFTLGVGDMLIPTWYEASRGGAINDNDRTVTFDLWGYTVDTSDDIKARDYDLLYPQHSGSSSNVGSASFASVFGFAQLSDIAAGTYGMATSLPGAPTWRTPVAGPGKVIVKWDAPEFLGGAAPETFEIKFRAKIWPTRVLEDNVVVYPSSHAALCEVKSNADGTSGATAVWLTRGDDAATT